jgi:hypothetical protein
VGDTIREELSSHVLPPLFEQNHIILPPGRKACHVVDALVPEDNVELLSYIYTSIVQLGAELRQAILLVPHRQTLSHQADSRIFLKVSDVGRTLFDLSIRKRDSGKKIVT